MIFLVKVSIGEISHVVSMLALDTSYIFNYVEWLNVDVHTGKIPRF